MLKKIKKYKIALSPASVTRSLKKKLDLDSVNQSFEQIVLEEIRKIEPLIVPTAVYNTYSKTDIPEPLSVFWTQASKKAVSISLIAATVGPELERQIENHANKKEDFKFALLDSIGWEAVDQSTQFVAKLLNEESKLEGCECTPLFPIDPAISKECLNLLESHKAEIALNDQGQISPFFSRLTFCFWNPISKRN